MKKIILTPDEVAKAIIMQASFIISKMTGIDLSPLQIISLKEAIQRDLEAGKYKDSIDYYNSIVYKLNN